MLDRPERMETHAVAEDRLLERVFVGAVLALGVPWPRDGDLVEQRKLHGAECTSGDETGYSQDDMMRSDDKPKHYVGTGVWPAVVTALVLATATVIFVAQNAHNVDLHFLWVDFRTSPAVLVLVTALLSVVASVVVGAAWRVQRRRRLTEREELERLRRATSESPVTTTP